MKRTYLSYDKGEILAAYRSGMSIDNIAIRFGLHRRLVNRILDAEGVQVAVWKCSSRRIRNVPVDEIVARYKNGESVKSLSKNFNVDRGLIVRRLRTAGIEIRNQSQSMYTRMARTPKEDIKRLVSAAHEAVRGRKKTIDEKGKMAATQQEVKNNQSGMELYLAKLLRDAGYPVAEQVAFEGYNFDLAVSNVDIEIFGGNWHFYGRHIARAPIRLRRVLDGGWNVLIVWANTRHPISHDTLMHVVSFLNLCQQRTTESPTLYRMIWGTGEVLLTGTSSDEVLYVKPLPRE